MKQVIFFSKILDSNQFSSYNTQTETAIIYKRLENFSGVSIPSLFYSKMAPHEGNLLIVSGYVPGQKNGSLHYISNRKIILISSYKSI